MTALGVGALAASAAVSHPAITFTFQIPRHHRGCPVSVLPSVIHNAGGCATVPSCPSRFLVVAFEALGQGPVHYEAHVGLVDAHAEGRGRNDHVITLPVGGPAREHVVFLPGR